MKNFAVFFLIFKTFFVYAKNNQIELGYDQSNIGVEQTTIKMMNNPSPNESYSIKIGKKQILKEADYFIELEEVVKKDRSYWNNLLLVSKNNTVLPTYQINLNYFIVSKNEELGVGFKYSQYLENHIPSLLLIGHFYLTNGDFLTLKGEGAYLDNFHNYYYFSYSHYLKDFLVFKPYFSTGESIEDLNVYDTFFLYGLEAKYDYSKEFSIKSYYEKTNRKNFSDYNKIGVILQFDF